MKKILAALSAFAIISVVSVPSMASAAQFIGSENSGGAVIISGTHRNVYTAGDTITVLSERVDGDLYAAGSQVSVRGNVEQDLMTASQNLKVEGEVGSDARLVGENIDLNSAIKGDLLLLASKLRTGSNFDVGGDVVVAGEDIELTGHIGGNVIVYGGDIRLLGTIDGNVQMWSDGEVSFGPQSQVKGVVTYRGEQAAVVPTGASVPNIDFTQTQSHTFDWRAFFAVTTFIRIAAAILLGLVLVLLFPKQVQKIFQSAEGDPGRSLLVGMLGALFVPFAIFLLLVTIAGYAIAIVAGLWYGLALFLSNVLAGVFAGAFILRRFRAQAELTVGWEAAVLGLILFRLIALVPIIGGIITTLLTLFIFGGMLRIARTEVQQK